MNQRVLVTYTCYTIYMLPIHTRTYTVHTVSRTQKYIQILVHTYPYSDTRPMYLYNTM